MAHGRTHVHDTRRLYFGPPHTSKWRFEVLKKQPDPTEDLTFIPLTGSLVDAVLGSFCAPPFKGDDSWPECSIGVADDSIVATDSSSAIIIGKPGGDHVATQMKETKLAAARAKLYGHVVQLKSIDRLVDDAGEVQLMPSVESLVQRNLSKMTPIAGVDPAALVAIGRVALAAGAISVELLQAKEAGEVLGFRFHVPAAHLNLFQRWEGDIEAKGVFQATRSKATTQSIPDLLESNSVSDVPTAAPKKGKKAAKADDVVPEFPATPISEPEPITIDTTAQNYRGHWLLPPIGILSAPDDDTVESGDYGPKILETLHSFGLSGHIKTSHVGPSITQYELGIRGGVPVNKIMAMSNDLQMRLAVTSVRIQAPIPGKDAIGVEVPNLRPRTVAMFEVCAVPAFALAEHRLVIAMGLDTTGRAIHADIEKLTHVLMGGATNSGKSIGLATLLTSLLLRNSPDDLRMVMIDPKRVELAFFAALPHLMYPVITDMKEVAPVLRALVELMEARYAELESAGARNIQSYRTKHPDEKMPFIVVVVDELADLMMQEGDDVQDLVIRLAQKARAVGIHLVLATQRPSVDVVTGLLKANVPTRIAFKTASGVDSKVILDQTGAENLVGKGDMFFAPMDGGGKLTRLQGAFVSEEDVTAICDFWRKQGQPAYDLMVDTDTTTVVDLRKAIAKAARGPARKTKGRAGK